MFGRKAEIQTLREELSFAREKRDKFWLELDGANLRARLAEESRDYFHAELDKQKEANYTLETALRDLNARYDMLKMFFEQLQITVKLPAKKGR